jgi:hypothetical protein
MILSAWPGNEVDLNPDARCHVEVESLTGRMTSLRITTLFAFLQSITGSPSSFGVGRSQIIINPTSETVILAHNVSAGASSAHINFFWITGDALNGGPRAGVDYCIWRFYIDGEQNASVALQMSQAAFVGQADPTAPWDNEFFVSDAR